MVQVSPDMPAAGPAGYDYAGTNLLGFSHNHLTGTGIGDLGNILILPTVGGNNLAPGKTPGEGQRTWFSHDQETARPGYYRVYLPEHGINVELTATARAALHRYTFPASTNAHILLDLAHGIGNQATEAGVTVEDNHTASGYRRSAGWGGDKVFYFVMEFSRPFEMAGIRCDGKNLPEREARGTDLKIHFDFHTKAGEKILVRVGLSTVSVAGARNNLNTEMPGWNFDAVAKAARAQWNQALGMIEIKSRDQNIKETFYSALYHTQLAPAVLSDVDGQFRGPDGQVHRTDGFDYYSELSLWDTFRAEHPLLTLIQPHRVNDFVNTFLAHYHIFGKHALPVWANAGKETWCMIGNHSIPVIVDAYQKGFRRWDPNAALDAMIDTVEQNRDQQDIYRRQGYLATAPSGDKSMSTAHDGRWQSVSKTLEFAYDDACIARFARELGRTNTAETYARRAENWTNVFDVSTGFMRGRTPAGGWVTPFDPYRINFDDYTEANAWQYNCFVPQNLPGLIARMGGDDKFAARLEEMFDTKKPIPNPWLDVTGLIGMYAHGNEPCHNFAYLYNYAGQPWRTQRRVRQIATTLYKNTTDGLCGNDDCGQISAWYVFAALGFYPVDPASGVYVLGSPLVDEATIQLDSRHYPGHSFTMVARHNSPADQYVQSATLDGRPLTRSWITHDEIVAGGKLVLQMGDTPNKAWAAQPGDRPGGVRH
jgi:predicted alpha-1,2-mannosidase